MAKKLLAACLISAMLLMGVCIFNVTGTQEGEEGVPEWEEKTVSEQMMLLENAEIFQTMIFSRCSHQVQRRIRVPQQLRQADFETVKSYYDVWNIRTITKEKVEMDRTIDLFCPEHIVIGLDRTGQVVMMENRYGDGMAILRVYEVPVEEEELRRTLLVGIGFGSKEEAEKWLKEQKILP